MVSARDRRHFARIAHAERELERESIAVGARRSPGENIEIGLELADFASAFGGERHRPDEISPASAWRARRRARR